MARQLVVEIVGKSDKLTKTLGDAATETKSFGDKINGAGNKMTKFATVPVVAFLGAATKAGVEEAAQMDALKKTLENTTGATKKQVDAVEDQIGAWQKVSNFSDGELRPAFENLVRSTKDVDKANRLMGTAMDIAAAKGLPVEQVAMAMSKAHDGNIGALGRLGIATKDASGETLSFDQVMQNANGTFGGQAQAASETTAGKMKQLQMRLGDLTEDIGMKLIPIIEKLVGWFANTFDALEKLGPGADIVLVALLALGVAGPILKAIALATKAWTAAQWLLNIALNANPIALVVLGIAVLVGGFILAWQHSETFRDVVTGAMGAVGGAVTWVVEKFMDMVGWLGGLPGRISRSVSGMWDGVKDAFRSALNWIIDKWNDFKIPGVKIAGVTVSPEVNFPNLPRFHTGGVVPGAPGSEVPAMLLAGERVLRRGESGGGPVVNITVQGSLIHERQLGRIVADALRDNKLVGVT